MPPYRLEWTPRFQRDLKKLSREDRDDILSVCDALASNPRPHGAEKLSMRPEHRIRAGKQRRFRVIYRIDDSLRLIVFHHVEDRKSVYRWLG